MILGVQLIGILFGLIMIYITYSYYKRGSYSHRSLTLWILVWLAFMTIIVVPETIYGVMQTLQIQRTADFLVMAGFLLYSVIIFYLYMTVKRNERRVIKLVRTLAEKEKQGTKKNMSKKEKNNETQRTKTSKKKKIKLQKK